MPHVLVKSIDCEVVAGISGTPSSVVLIRVCH